MMGLRRRMQWGGLALMAALAGIGMRPGEALAQSSKGDTSVDSARSKEATARFREGTKAADAGLWEKARLAFASAWELKQHWQIAAHLGRAELQTGHNREAAEHLTYFLREATGVPEADLKKSRAMLDQALSKVASVTVRVNVEGAEVFVDGRSAGRSPISGVIYVDPGRRTFEAKREGYATATATEEMKAGSKPTVELSLEKPEDVLKQPPVPVTDRQAGPNKVLAISGAGLAGALALAGAGFAIAWRVKANEADSYQHKYPKGSPEEDKFIDARGERNGLAGLAWITLGAAGVFGGATALYWTLSPSNSTGSRSPAVTQVAIHGASVRVVTHW